MVDSFQLESASVTDRGLSNKRPQNEDSFLEIPESGIFAVADGVGGAEAGEVASQMAVEILAEAFVNKTGLSDAEEVMRMALGQANDAIHRMSNELPQLSSMATTIVALHIAGNIATIGHAGDSRLYRLDANGTLFRETDDHSMVAEEVRAGRMTAEQAENHPGKNIISRALGAEPTVEVDLKTILVDPNTTFLICSDGVTRHIADAELAALLRTIPNPADICHRIKEICFDRGAEDNLTAVIVKILGTGRGAAAPPPSRGFPDFDEDTVATARPATASEAAGHFDPRELLELDTAELTVPAKRPEQPPPAASVSSTEPPFVDRRRPQPQQEAQPAAAPSSEAGESAAISGNDEYETIANIPFETAPAASDASPSSTGHFDTPQEYTVERTGSGSLGKIAGSVALLVLGSLIGLAGYHYLLLDRSAQQVPPPITEMRSGNQQLTAFEDNRRLLDKDPEAALKQFLNEPKEAENSFLIGRAYLLTGKYPEARKAFVEALDLIAAGKVDPNNTRTLQRDISIALTIADDTSAQKNFAKELQDPKVAASPPAGDQKPAPR